MLRAARRQGVERAERREIRNCLEKTCQNWRLLVAGVGSYSKSDYQPAAGARRNEHGAHE
jgi:hypothetical protein